MKVSYQRMYSIGVYLNERIGFEYDMPVEPTSEEQILTQVEVLKRLCDEAHRRLNPSLGQISEAQYQSFSPEKIPEQQVEKQSPGQIIEAIQKCTELDGDFGLRSYKLLTGNPLIKEAYDKRLKELQV